MNRKLLFGTLLLVAVLGGSLVAWAAGPLWSTLSQPLSPSAILPTSLAAPTWTGQTTIGSTITVTTTMSPTPTNSQTVTFYYTYLSTASSATAVTENANTGLVTISTVPSSGNSATTQFQIPSTTTMYFIAKIANTV